MGVSSGKPRDSQRSFLATVLEVQRSANSAPFDLMRTIEACLDATVGCTAATHACVRMQDPTQSWYRSRHTGTDAMPARWQDARPIAEWLRTTPSAGLTGRAGRTRQARIELCVPLLDGADAVGLLIVHTSRPEGFANLDESRIAVLAGVMADAVRRVQAERVVRRQALAFATIHDAVIVVSPSRRIVDWNPAAVSMFGYTREQAVGRRPHFLTRDPQVSRDILRAMKESQPWSGEHRYWKASGGNGLCQTQFVPVFDDARAFTCMIVVCRDVTAQRQLEVELLQSQKLEAVGRLAAGIAREIETPIQYVSDNLRFARDAWRSVRPLLSELEAVEKACRDQQLLVEECEAVQALAVQVDAGYLMHEVPRAIDEALEGAGRVASIVRGMQSLSHSSGGARSPVNVNVPVETMIAVSRHEWATVGDLTLDYGIELPMVWGNADELTQLSLELLMNAVGAIKARRSDGAQRSTHGRIAVRTFARDGGVVLSVSDNGVGITSEVAPLLFDPVFSTRAIGQGVGQGVGQGLLIARGIAQRHGGDITLESQPGVGTTFVVWLPVYSAAEHEPS